MLSKYELCLDKWFGMIVPEILSYVCEVLIIAYTNDCTFVHVYLHVIEGKGGRNKNCKAN